MSIAMRDAMTWEDKLSIVARVVGMTALLAGCGDDAPSPGPEDAGRAGADAAMPAADGGTPGADAGVFGCDGIDCSGHGTCTEDEGPRCECDEGYRSVGLGCVDEGDTTGLFVDLPAEGEIAVALHPSAAGEQTVSFGVPFPRGVLSDPSLVRVSVDGTEVPSVSEALGQWRSLSGAETSVRGVLVHARVTFSEEPLNAVVSYGAAPSVALEVPANVRDAWVGNDDYAMPGVQEPAVFAALSPEWLSQCLLRTRTAPVGALGWWDEATVEFSDTAVNDVDAQVTEANRIDYEASAAPWLFDRPMTLFNTYIRTGDVKWLRHAHRATQYYAAHISETGYFDLKRDDMKYSYGEAMWLDVLLTGDRQLVEKIEAVASAGARWNPTYTAGTNFWTERHQTYALLAALSAWEATGETVHGDRVREIFEATYNHLQSPPVGDASDGCLLHTERSHEGNSNEAPICSPWMSALLSDAVWRYYLQSEDERALEALASFAGFVSSVATYEVASGTFAGRTVPRYLVSSSHTPDDSPGSDMEHTCDAAGLVYRGAWAARELGRDNAAMLSTAEALLASCEANLNYWHRPGGPAAGYSEWRLAPPRKFSWWFGTTSDLTWFRSELR